MAKSESRHNNNELQTEDGSDEVERSLELLDKVLLEFEEEQDNMPVANEPESPSQGHQSEDDGYMSMNGRRAKFVPDFLPTEEILSTNEKYSPPTPEEAEKIISDLLPMISDSNDKFDVSKIPPIEFKFSNNYENLNSNNNTTESNATSVLNSLVSISTVSTAAPLQTTLPKTRTAIGHSSHYGSLPSTNANKCYERNHNDDNIYNDFFLKRIGINDVHNAVLKRGVRMPDTIINEHPVTIYPGPLNQKRAPTIKSTLPGTSIQEVCRKVDSELDSLSPQDLNSPDNEVNSSTSKLNNGFVLHNNDFIRKPISPIKTSLSQFSPTNSITPLEVKISIQTMDNLMNNRRTKISNRQMNDKNSTRTNQLHKEGDDDDDKFSDDSLEETSLPPPAPPPVIPPPPSLSAPVTPNKRHSIAWEVNLDDLCSKGNNVKATKMQSCERNSVSAKSGSESLSQSTSSSPEHSSASNNKISSDWPDPPDIPICSTEDEAASIYSDSDDVIPHLTDLGDGGGTYVIRKGKRRQRIIDSMNTSVSLSSINSKLSNEKLCEEEEKSSNPILNVPSPVYPPSMMTPNSRHSIDLGASPRNKVITNSFISNHVVNSPRSRLSLDLGSPSITNYHVKSANKPISVTTPTSTNSPSIIKINSPTSPLVANSAPFPSRYTEFKTYNSTFDGLQALDSHVNNSTTNANNICITSNGNNHRVGSHITQSSDNSLTRVSSLPSINPQNQSTDASSTPRRELAPPIEEDEEDSDGNRAAPLRQIENNISALLRGEIQIAQVPASRSNRPIGFRPGVHKSESAKEMLLSQNYFGPLPDSPHSSPEPDSDEFPPLPASPSVDDDIVSNISSHRNRLHNDHSYRNETRAPAVPPHAISMNSLKCRSESRSMEGCYKSYRNGSLPMPSSRSPPSHSIPSDSANNSSSRRRPICNGFPKRSAQSPREERRLQTSCSLPETPIFARGTDIARTPHRRAAPDPPILSSMNRASTASRQNNLHSTSIVGIGCSTIGSTGSRTNPRGFNHTIQANGAMMPISGLPARGWRRQPRASASTEHLDRLQGSLRAWESTATRKTTTLPPNMTPPKFFNSKSPRDALRRVTSLLINRKGNGTTLKEKEAKKTKKPNEIDNDNVFVQPIDSHRSPNSVGNIETPVQPKKKGFFKSFWKKSRHYSLEQN